MQLTDQEMQALSPMMQHYMKTKEEYPGCILFYRLGDFYEMFFEDALTASKELEITLTGKNCGLEERAPMCGVPFHAVDSYLTRLVNKGYKVAICEQMEDPKLAKGIVKREVIRVVTPGTNIDSTALEESRNNYLAVIAFVNSVYGLSLADVSTGDVFVTELDQKQKLYDELMKYNPSEIAVNTAFEDSEIDMESFSHTFHAAITVLDSSYYDEKLSIDVIYQHFHVNSLEGLGLTDFPNGAIACGAMFKYLIETQKSDLSHMMHLSPYVSGNFMLIDSSTRRNLELVETMREKEKRGSLLWVLDKTKTAMGARTLRAFLEQPLIDKESINLRLDAVEELSNHMVTREELREYLNPVYDLERLITRISYRTANPRDLIAFRNSIEVLPAIRTQLNEFQSDILINIYNDLDPLRDLYDLIFKSIAEEPPISTHDGDILKLGFSAEVDELRSAKTEGKVWLAELEAREKERTGIKNLRVKYNKVFGYYIEVTNSNLNMVPDDYIRKQTLTNAERFYTEELKELENKILGSEDRLYSLENEIYNNILTTIADEVARIQKTAKAIANLDVFLSLSLVAEKNHYIRPEINNDGILDIKDGRHPVVEKMIPNDMFIVNDTYLNQEDNRIAIITGPNMAGKSTYMRQTALIVLMAQIGSFVPASYANIGLVDRIFTRVGASDDLASGQSTFMVEMNEVANILRNATCNSLVILDEIGRGTSTYDGLSIAWAVVEYISDTKKIGAKTLFATHYHELTELEGKIKGVNNYCIAVKENGDDIVFLRKIIKGGADKSYGIQVARLAGLPQFVIDRAKDIVEQLVSNDLLKNAKSIEVVTDSKFAESETAMSNTSSEASSSETSSDSLNQKSLSKRRKKETEGQLSLFDYNPNQDLLDELKNLNISEMTPLQALNKLSELQAKIEERY